MHTEILVWICLAAFCAGFIDAIVGGGGLIQTPASLILLQAHPVANILATVKLPSFTGTAVATLQYLKKVRINLKLTVYMMITAGAASFLGSWVLTKVSNELMKPILVVVLLGVAVYTFFKKDFGQLVKEKIFTQSIWKGILIAAIIGFYDGFIGPGTGSFLILVFIAILGFDFLQSSAHAKMVNLATNGGSIILFILKGKVLWNFALPMAASNALGGYIGAKIAIKKGNQFIRMFFLIIVISTLCRFAWDVFHPF